MKLFLLPLLLLAGCPKKEMKSLDEIEREKRLQELFEEEDEIFDDLPEAGENDENQDPKTTD